MRLKLAFLDAKVVDRSATELVMRYPVAHDSIFLSQALLLAGWADRNHVFFRLEESIIVVRCRPVVNRRFKTHLEVSHTHRVRITQRGLISKLKLFGSPGWFGRCLILELRWSVWLREGKVWVAWFSLSGLVILGCRCHLWARQRVLSGIEVLVLSRR